MGPTALFQPTAAGFSPETVRSNPVPSDIQLHRVLNQMLIRRHNLSAQFFGSPLEDLSSLPVEQSFCFSEPTEGILVIRTSRLFEKFLELKTEQKETFLELAILFFHQLTMDTWKVDTRTAKPALFKSSAPVAWPDRKPDTACTLFVEDLPLEIRLWTPIGANEKENWRAFRK